MVTLAAGGAILIVAVNIFGSIETTVDNTLKAQGYEIRMDFDRPYGVKKVERTAFGIPQVTAAESWGGGTAVLEGPRGLDGASFSIDALPKDGKLLHLPFIAGRWLKAGDSNALVINQGLRHKDPQFEVGRKVRLRIDGRVSTWHIIGVVREMGSEPRAYANKTYFDKYCMEGNRVRSLVVATHPEPRRPMGKFSFFNHFRHLQAVPAAGTVETKPILNLLEERMEAGGFVVAQSEDAAGFRKVLEEHLKIIAVFLIMMSLLTVVIGGLGLASSMSINVIERMREIGIMRSIGGTKRTIVHLFIKEGIITGLMSWFVSVILSIPLTHLIGASFGNIFFQAPLDLNFGHHGVIAWLALVTFIAVTASFFPAQKATQLAVREVLSYE
jgi:putative ABC transport system permease protein